MTPEEEIIDPSFDEPCRDCLGAGSGDNEEGFEETCQRCGGTGVEPNNFPDFDEDE